MTAERTRSGQADVIVVTGAGGMGVAVVRRVGAGSTVMLADVDKVNLDSQIGLLMASGYRVVGQVVDVSEKASIEELAAAAQAHGPVVGVVHTAGVSPVQAPVDAILRVDLLGTARMLDAFADVISSGGAGVFIASMAGTMGSLDPDLERRLTTTPTDQLLELPRAFSRRRRRPWYRVCDLQARQPASCSTRVASLGRPWSPSQFDLTRCRCHRDGRSRAGWASRRDHAANGGR